MATYLDRILAEHRERASSDRRSLDRVLEEVSEVAPCRGFAAALRGRAEMAVIAEIKRRSPSKGDLFPDLDPAALAATYESAGARCMSVLTDHSNFGGSPEDLRAARSAVSLPVIRKDFTVSPLDVLDARLMGADCVLLIVAALDDPELADFASLAVEVGIDTLVEVHDEAELERALIHTKSPMIGVNQRDLVTFEVDQDRAVRVASEIPTDVVRVAESGVRGPADAAALAAAGYDAVLVGEHLVTSADVSKSVAELAVPRN